MRGSCEGGERRAIVRKPDFWMRHETSHRGCPGNTAGEFSARRDSSGGLRRDTRRTRTHRLLHRSEPHPWWTIGHCRRHRTRAVGRGASPAGDRNRKPFKNFKTSAKQSRHGWPGIRCTAKPQRRPRRVRNFAPGSAVGRVSRRRNPPMQGRSWRITLRSIFKQLKTHHHIPAARCARVVRELPPDRGRGECRVSVAPAASRAK